MSKTLLENKYNSSSVENKWYDHWLEKKYFHADSNSKKEPYTIVIPPPNVTGMLTMGHVLNNTIQDILIRKARMEGKEACWIPGTDHASIATETKVIKMLEEKGINKNDLSREEFLENAWEWKEKYGGIIISQLKKLGCSCDWERERFTMDEGYSNAVLESFVKLYNKGLIYKGHRLVNWCPASKSAISDEEVIHKEINGHLWYLKYPIKGEDKYLVVATTRPETMLGDSAVAVNPNDKRYKKHIGKTIDLPLVGREIPIIADDYVDPDFGTGCVKITPAHDPNDFEIGNRHGLEFINIMNDDASINENAPAKYIGQNRFDARKQIIHDIDQIGLLYKTENYVNKIGFSERGGVPIEFYMSDQWFMKMNDLVKPAIAAVKSGEIKFHPEHWVKTYNHWMDNIKDWCISRQLLWGHQIPVWYHKEDKTRLHVSVNGPDDIENWEQDKDVLDTWASSWIWPMGVHNWPEENEDLNKFFPTNTLVTGPDIIFFWVARMIITGYEFLDKKPFTDVYFTSILRDETGKKLSKSLGNSPDPFDLFEEYGTDAVRFGIMLMAPQGLDVLFSKERLEIGRNFMNKLWNACRFISMNKPDNWIDGQSADEVELRLPDKWIINRLNRAIKNYNKQMDRFHFNEAAKVLYDYIWNDFCDWYIEIAKTRFYSDDDDSKMITYNICVESIRKILPLLHPYTPFITEELWSFFKIENDKDLIISPLPAINKSAINEKIDNEMNILKDVISCVRAVRSRMNIPPSKKIELKIKSNKNQKNFIDQNNELIISLAKLNSYSVGSSIQKPSQSVASVVHGMELYIPLEGLVDLEKERAQLNKRRTKIEELLVGIDNKLSNENFLANAPEKIINRENTKKIDLKDELEKINSNIKMLS
ncbi:MAG: valine--tRNA ligase [Candidatus Marinimicrobia bacterium]|nr:valine--tRNA ligase [Candidatus Neomarinimicrobiota bacterium]